MTKLRIRLTSDRTALTVALQDTAPTRQLISQLPVTVEFRDFAGHERIADLARPLNVENEPDGTDAQAGDLAYYAPWGNLAFFYRPAPHAAGLVRLGTLEPVAGEVTDLTGRVTVELID